jgi:hypothetical protein
MTKPGVSAAAGAIAFPMRPVGANQLIRAAALSAD